MSPWIKCVAQSGKRLSGGEGSSNYFVVDDKNLLKKYGFRSIRIDKRLSFLDLTTRHHLESVL